MKLFCLQCDKYDDDNDDDDDSDVDDDGGGSGNLFTLWQM